MQNNNNYKRRKAKGFPKSRANTKRDADNNQKASSKDTTPRNHYNDPAWYFRYPELMQATAKIPFPNRPGMRIKEVFDTNWVVGDNVSDVALDNHITIPGILTLNWVPSIGTSNDSTDPASLTAFELWSNVRKEFSGNLNADAPDMFIQIMALSSIYSYIAYLKRVYRVLGTASPQNYMLPYGVMRAMNYTHEQTTDLIARKTELYGITNTLIRMCGKFICPAVFDVINRHYWLNDRIYTDANTTNSQFYLFNPVGFYSFKLLDNPQGELSGGLEFVNLNVTNLTGDSLIQYLYEYGLNMINSLSSWDSAYEINGYFMKAYGSSAFIIAPLDISETLEAVYSEEVLYQIQNSTAVPVAFTDLSAMTVSNNITQNPLNNAIIASPTVSVVYDNVPGYVRYNEGGIINIPDGFDSPEFIVEATRLKTVFQPRNSTKAGVTFDVKCATEFILYMSITTPSAYDGEAGYFYIPGGTIVSLLGETDKSVQRTISRTAWLSWFSHHPAIPFGVLYNHDGTDTLAYSFFSDVENVGTMSLKEFEDINRVCLFSEFSSFNNNK